MGLPAGEQVAARVAELVEAGHGDRDHSALLLAYEPQPSTTLTEGSDPLNDDDAQHREQFKV